MAAVPQLTWAQVIARRLARQGLGEPLRGVGVEGVVAAMCGAHAQVLAAGEVSIALRLAGGTRSAVREAIWGERSVIKTRGPRGTVHLLPTRDLPMWMGALGALPSGPSPFGAGVRMSEEQTDAVVAAIGAALADAELTLDELTEAIVAEVGAWAGELVMPAFQGCWPRWCQVMDTATYRGALCFGANRGRKVTYTSPRRWLPNFRPAEGRVALADLLRGYLRAYGPATPQHFARWLSTSLRWAEGLFASLGDGLQEVEVEGLRAWVVAGDTAMPDEPPSGVRLLPYFDAYAVGSHPREVLFPGRAGERALARGQAGNFPTLLVGGVVGGVWHQRRSGKRIAVTVEPLAPLTEDQRRELDERVARVGELLEGAPTLTIGPVTVGPHA